MAKKVNISHIANKIQFIYGDECEKNAVSIIIYNNDNKFFFDSDFKNEMSDDEVEALLLRGAVVYKNGKYYMPSSFNMDTVSFNSSSKFDIPKIFFNGDKPTTKDPTNAIMEYIANDEHFKVHVEIKCQGTSSMGYPKKNYTIKLYEDEALTKKVKKNFNSWGEQNKFCLKANYIDHSHARNICCARLWGEVVKSRNDFAELPEELTSSPNNGAIDGFPVKLYYNNSYEGLYTLNIPKDAWMANMDSKRNDHCILCGEEYVSGCFATVDATLWSDEIHDVMPDNIINSFNSFQDFVINSSDADFVEHLHEYANVNSLIDYYIFNYLICGLDGMGKNQLFLTYDGVIWIASAYDMDGTIGLHADGLSFVSPHYKMQENYESGIHSPVSGGNQLYVRLKDLFADDIKHRYLELRDTVLSFTNVVNTFENFMNAIDKELYEEDPTIYPDIPSTAENNIRQIRNYYKNRLLYVDGMMDNAIVAKYTCNAPNVLPAFNDEYVDYVIYEVDNNNGTWTTTINRITESRPTHISFQHNKNLISVEHLDVSEVTSMHGLFSECSNLTDVNCSNWDTRKSVYMSSMFYYCVNLNSPDVTNWDTSKVIDLSNMFHGCAKIEYLDLSRWDVSEVSSIAGLTQDCIHLSYLDLSGWNTRELTNMSAAFSGGSGNTELFEIKGIEGLTTDKVTNMRALFYNHQALSMLDLSGWDVSNVRDMAYIFFDTFSLKTMKSMKNISTSFTVPVNLDEVSLLDLIDNLAEVSHECTISVYLKHAQYLSDDVRNAIADKRWNLEIYDY